MVTVKVLGSGCAKCHKLEELARGAAAALGAEVRFEKVTGYADIAGYNVMVTPGLVINEKVVSSGRLPTTAEITTWLTDALMADEGAEN
jgi:small redox-active disulfide protein 2